MGEAVGRKLGQSLQERWKVDEKGKGLGTGLPCQLHMTGRVKIKKKPEQRVL